jgi:hypothetical protein
MCASLFGAVMLALLVALPGWAWCGAASSWVRRLLMALAVGPVLILLAALVLAEAGLFERPWLVGASVLLALAGWVRRASRPRWIELPLTALVLSTLVVILLLLPGRGGWIVGGWDPGLYMNEGLLLARTGDLRPGADPILSQLGAEALSWFTVAQRTYVDLFPGLPVDIQTATIQPSFPRLTSVAAGLLAVTVGPDAALRLPLFAGAFALLAWGIAFGSRGGWVALVVLALQPVFLYHTQVPSSEMIELALVGLLVHALLPASPLARPVAWTALLLFLACANRLSFPLFGGLLLCARAAGDLDRTDRRTVLFEHLALASALLAGLLYPHLTTPVAVAKLAHVLPQIGRAVVLMIAVVLALDGVAWTCAHRLVLWHGWMLRWLGPVAGVIGVGWLVMQRASGAEWSTNLQALLAYTGRPLLAAAAFGLLLLLGDWRAPRRSLLAMVLLLATLIILHQKHAAELYPWATKRWLPFTLPLLAWGVGEVVAKVPAGRWRALASGGVVALLIPSLPLARAAWRCAEFEGVSDVLADVAAHVPPHSLVVADHFRWATPLSLAHGRTSVNGERLWRHPERAATAATWSRLRELARADTPIYLFTSTADGAARLGPVTAGCMPLWREQVTYREVAHHRRSRGFSLRERSKEFALYAWPPEASTP